MKSIYEKETPAQVWMKLKKSIESTRQLGINEFIKIYKNQKSRKADPLKWGDELEFYLAKFDHSQKRVRLCTKSDKIIEITDKWKKEEGSKRPCLYKYELASYVIEGIPGKPYGLSKTEKNPDVFFDQLLEMEKNLAIRRKEIGPLLDENEFMVFITHFPRVGCEDFTCPKDEINLATSNTQSIFMPKSAYYQLDPLCYEAAVNINERIGRKISVNIPIFKDKNTPDPFIEKYPYFHTETRQAAKPDHIYMDDFLFGFSTNNLQVTIQGSNIDESKFLFDQLIPMTSILMSLSAGAPIFRGYLSDVDSSQSIMSQGCDDRTKQELGEEPIKYCDKYKKFEKTKEHGIHNPVRSCECGDNHFLVPSPRYGGIGTYLSEEGDKYNDKPITYNIDYYEKMVKAGVDPIMARYLAFLLIREPVGLTYEFLDKYEEPNPNFLKIIWSSWGDIRFKPPYSTDPSSDLGWRIEFRPMDLQMNDFEHAAYDSFVVLLAKTILDYNLNLLIPLSKNDKNMKNSEERDAVNRCKFWFRKNIVRKDGCDDECELMTLDKIINGGEDFPGLMSFIRSYLNKFEINEKTRNRINQYLKLISDRASGRTLTTAQWIRNQVRNHPAYKFDSVVNDEITYDLLLRMQKIANDNF